MGALAILTSSVGVISAQSRRLPQESGGAVNLRDTEPGWDIGPGPPRSYGWHSLSTPGAGCPACRQVASGMETVATNPPRHLRPRARTVLVRFARRSVLRRVPAPAPSAPISSSFPRQDLSRCLTLTHTGSSRSSSSGSATRSSGRRPWRGSKSDCALSAPVARGEVLSKGMDRVVGARPAPSR